MTRTSDPTALVRRTATGVRDLFDPGALAARVDPIAFGGALGETARKLLAHPLPAARSTLGLAAGSGRATLAALAAIVFAAGDDPSSIDDHG